jgi:shikimate kinase
MQRILLTGISGVAKSTLVRELAQRGYWAVDLDAAPFSEWAALTDDLVAAAGTPVEADRDWVWNAEQVAALLADEAADTLIMSGCAANMGPFVPKFDQIVLLTAPAAVISERLRTRTNNPYGQQADERARVLALQASVEPALRRIAHHEIDTNVPLEALVQIILRLVQGEPASTHEAD